MNTLPDWLVPITLPMPATRGAVNVYLIRGRDEVGLVDTGMDDALSRAALMAALEENGLALSDIDHVLCTHYHSDHCGLGATFLEAGAEVMMSAVDAASLDKFFSAPEKDKHRAAFFGRHRVPDDFAERVFAMFPFFRNLQERFAPSRTIEDGEAISMGGIRFEALLMPGHTRGHVCLLEPASGVLLSGDHVIPDIATQVSLREEAMGTDPMGAFLSSLERVCELGPRAGLGGHGAPMENVAARAAEVVRHHHARLEEIAAALSREPVSAYDLVLTVFGGKRQPFARWLAMSQTLAYLEHLVRLGRAVEVEVEGRFEYAIS